LTLTMELVVVVAHLAHLLSLLGLDPFADVESGSEEARGAASENARAYADPYLRRVFSKGDRFFSRSLSADRLGYAVVLRDIGSPPADCRTASFASETTKATTRVALAEHDSEIAALVGATPVEEPPEVEVAAVRRLPHTVGTDRGGDGAEQIFRETAHRFVLLSPN
jgi:hypothetical protein